MIKIRLLIFITLILIGCNTRKEKSTLGNYSIEQDSNGFITNLIIRHVGNDSDSTIIDFYDNGQIRKISPYKKGYIYPSQLLFYKTGGIYYIRQYVIPTNNDETISNQIYAFDHEQYIVPSLSVMSIVEREDDMHSVYWASGFGEKGKVCLIDSIAVNAYNRYFLQDIPESKPIFKYSPSAQNGIAFEYTDADSQMFSIKVHIGDSIPTMHNVPK